MAQLQGRVGDGSQAAAVHAARARRHAVTLPVTDRLEPDYAVATARGGLHGALRARAAPPRRRRSRDAEVLKAVMPEEGAKVEALVFLDSRQLLALGERTGLGDPRLPAVRDDLRRIRAPVWSSRAQRADRHDRGAVPRDPMTQYADNEYLFTSESVTEGHPDKVADQISDGVLDAVLRDDPMGRVACETLVNTGLVVVSGEISTTTYVDIQEVARETIRKIGYIDADLGFWPTPARSSTRSTSSRPTSPRASTRPTRPGPTRPTTTSSTSPAPATRA